MPRSVGSASAGGCVPIGQAELDQPTGQPETGERPGAAASPRRRRVSPRGCGWPPAADPLPGRRVGRLRPLEVVAVQLAGCPAGTGPRSSPPTPSPGRRPGSGGPATVSPYGGHVDHRAVRAVPDEDDLPAECRWLAAWRRRTSSAYSHLSMASLLTPRRTGSARRQSSVTRPASTRSAGWSRRPTASSIRRSWVTSSSVPGVGVQRRLQLLDRRQVEVVGRLVEHQQVDAARLQQRQRRPGPLARRQRRRRPQHVVGPQAELGQQRAHLGRRPGRARPRRTRRAAARRRGTAPRAWSTSPTTTPGPSAALPVVERQPAEQRGRAASTCPTPLAPVIATRSRPVDLQVDRAEGEVAAPHHRAAQRGDDRAGAGRGGDLHPQLPLLARLLDHLQPLDQPLGLPGLGGLLLASPRRGTCGRSCRCPVALRRALRTPFSIQARCMRARASSAGPGVGVLLVVLAGVPAGDLALLQVGRRSRRRRRVTCCWARSSSTTRVDGAGEELAVVADHARCRRAGPSTNRSSRSRPSRSRSLVGSSSRKTS